MIDKILDIERIIVVYINSLHTQWGDNIMLFLSHKLSFIPLYLAVVLFIFLRKNFYLKSALYKNNWKYALIFIGAIVVTFVLTDQISHSIIKPLVCRFRPTYDPYIQDLLHIPDGRGGLYGFVSSHSSNIWGFAIISSMIIKRKPYTICIYILASLVCLSRIYLGRHYLGDILGGLILGIACAYFVYYCTQVIVRKMRNNF